MTNANNISSGSGGGSSPSAITGAPSASANPRGLQQKLTRLLTGLQTAVPAGTSIQVRGQLLDKSELEDQVSQILSAFQALSTALTAAKAARVQLTGQLHARLAILAGLLALAGCCLTVSSEVGGESGAGGHNTGTGMGAGSASASSGTTGGATTGSSPTILSPTVLSEAGIGLVFGPIAMATVPGGTPNAARVAFSLLGESDRSDAGPSEVRFYTLGGDGQLIAPFPSTFSIIVASISAGSNARPNLTITDDGSQVAVCWEDFGISTNPYGGNPDSACQLVRCSSIPEDGFPKPTYSNCGRSPELVYDPSAARTILFIQMEGGIEGWAYGEDWSESIGEPADPQGPYAATLLGNARYGLLGYGSPDLGPPGLLLSPTGFPGASVGEPRSVTLDATFASNGQFAAASNIGTQSVGVIELDDAGPRVLVWQVDAGMGETSQFESTDRVIGPVGAAICPGGFAYLAMTSWGMLMVNETTFGGAISAGAGRQFVLGSLMSNPTSMAVVPSPDGGLFLAVSSQSQIAVYPVGCE